MTAQFDNTDFVSHTQYHLIAVNRKNRCIDISSVIKGVERGTRYVVIVK